MNRHSDRQLFEKEVKRIAGELIKLARRDEKGLYWISPGVHKQGEPVESNDLFNGNAGIILFFLALYDYDKKQVYLQTALDAAGRLLQHEQVNHPQFYTFYGGAAGVLYVCIQLYKATGQTPYLEKALELEKDYRAGFNSRVNQYDLLSGQAGILLAVLHLYANTKESSLLITIDEIINKLITGSHPGRTGLKWDTNKHGYDSLTGFSHGASGIAFVLLQAAQFLQAPGLQYLAMQAYEYENNYYEQQTGNFMDLRVGAARMTAIREQYQYELNNWPIAAFQPTMSGISSWAHGAAGCAISRLFAINTKHHQPYAGQARKALAYSWQYFKQQKLIDYSLSSGYGGIAAAFTLAAQVLNEPVWQTRASIIARSAIAYYSKEHTYNSKIKRSTTDCGLFSGLAGVGYWLLNCIQPHVANNIIHPAIDDTAINNEATEAISKKYSVENVKTYLRNNSQPDIINGLRKKHTGFLQFRQRWLLAQQCFSALQQLTDTQWLNQHFKTADHLVTTTEGEEQAPVLYYCHEAGIGKIPVPRFTIVLLERFNKGEKLAVVIDFIHSSFYTDEPESRVQQMIIEQVKELVKAGFLLAV
ncbi:MAG TPA: lanthionine synthetase LanC family protein [Niastella sp.]